MVNENTENKDSQEFSEGITSPQPKDGKYPSPKDQVTKNIIQNQEKKDTKVDLESVTDLSQEEKLFAALGYFNVLCLIPLLLKKDSNYCQFHGKQGMVVFIFIFLSHILTVIPYFTYFIWSVYPIFSLLMAALAYSGRWTKIPGVYDLSKKINV